MNMLVTQPFMSAVENLGAKNSSFASNYGKVNKIFREFATSRGVNLSKLLMIEVCDDRKRDYINSNLMNHIHSLDKSDRYKSVAVSRIKGILSLLWSNTGETSSEVENATIVPDFMLCILPILSRKGMDGVSCSVDSKGVDQTARRLKSPLSDAGQRLLTAFLSVVEQRNINDLDSLFITFRSDIQEKIKELNIPSRWRAAASLLTYVRRRLGYKSLRETRHNFEVHFDKFPPRLKEQCLKFIEKAPMGLDSEPLLRSRAEKQGIKVKRLSQRTIDLYTNTLSRFLGKIEFDSYEEIDVTSFLKISVEDISDNDGINTSRLFNPLIDKIRELEQIRKSDFRDKGFDTSQFASFLSALKTIAVFNGIFKYHELFNKAYVLREDKKTRKERRDLKKKTYDLDWVDSEIDRLSQRFFSIVQSKSFKFDKLKNNFHNSAEDMRFCIFFTSLVMLRYTGVRQQCIRDCVVNKNIFFESDGSIRLHWTEDQVKNGRELNIHISSKHHALTHHLFLKTISTYWKKLYPYIAQNSTGNLNNQLFALADRGKFHNFEEYDSGNFYTIFESWTLLYFNFGDRIREFKRGINPHFFRGLLTDWLILKLGVSIKSVAEFIGDDENTLRMSYLDGHRVADAQDALNQANENLRLRQRNSSEDTTLLFLQSELKRLGNQVDLLTSENLSLKNNLQTLANTNHQEIMEMLSKLQIKTL